MFKNEEYLLIRGGLAAVWAYQGIWCKLLSPNPRHRGITQAAGFRWALAPIGLVEGMIAIWVLAGWLPVVAAVVQTALIAAMNAGGVWRTRMLIADPVGMILQNAAFLVLAWVSAGVLHAR